MRIENLRKIKENGIEKAVATVIFEDNERPPADVYFHTSEEYNQFLGLNPDAFLLAGFISAMNMGEKRIWIQGKVDEALKNGIIKNMQTYQKWYGRKYRVLPIETDNKDFTQNKNTNLNTGLFFSGGLDSIYSLRTNRLKYGREHPLYVKDCFIVDGFDMHRFSMSKEGSYIFERAVNSARKVTDEAGANLIPVTTNLRHYFNGDEMFWPNWHFGAALAAIGHCFISRISSVFIASSFAPSMLEPCGSHPDIDHNYSGSDLKVIHDDLCSTFEKIKLIIQWETGFQNIRSCYQNDENNLNCCHCEKCVRIMITLMALGALDRSQTFPIHQISHSLLNNVLQKQTKEAWFSSWYVPLVPLLIKQGRQDLANLILKENSIKAKVRRFDQCYFQGKLKNLINSLR